MSLKDRVGSDASRGAATELAGGDLKGKDFRESKRALNKQDRVNNRAERKASRRGDQITDGYEGYKGFSTKEHQADRYFDELSKKRTRNIVAGTAAAALTGGAALGAIGAAAAAVPVVGAGAAGGTAAAVTGATTAAVAGTTAATTVGTTAAVGAGTTAAVEGAKFLPKAIQGVKKAKEVVDTVGQVVDTVGQVVDTGKQVAQMFQQPEPTTDMNQIAPQQQVGFSPQVYQQYGMNMNYGFNPKSAPAVTPSGPAYLSSVYNPVGNI
jgi:hypothetical protein